MDAHTFDVVIIGAGPIGLLIAYGLQSMGISTIVIERDVKAELPMYGRACTLYPRSCEMLQQYGLLDKMTQIGFIARGGATFDKNGDRVSSRGWHTMFAAMGSTYLDFILNIRLKYSEDIFAEAYQKIGGQIMSGWALTTFITEGSGQSDTTVVASIQNVADKSTKIVKGRYLIGADGGRSTVRHLTSIKSERSPTYGPTLRWIRVDAVVKTDMPESELGFASIESPTHGAVLWVNLDHGRTRIGYCLPPDKAEEFGNSITEAQAVEEAQKALAPWNLTVETVDWYTNYSVHQSLAIDYIDGHVILAGDACHTHSSATAQGMNTGIHDAVNLAWKLAGVIKGRFTENVLATYTTERRSAGVHLIELDQAYSKLMSGIIPEKYQGRSDDANVVQGILWDEEIQFNMGLGVSYDDNILNRRSANGNINAGSRARDALLYRPGSRLPVRLQQITPNHGLFWIVVFTGEPALTREQVASFRAFLDTNELLQILQKTDVVRFITIVRGDQSLAELVLGGPPFGDVFYDYDGQAHRNYGLSLRGGGVAILRPDGIFGFGARLASGTEIVDYFKGFVKVDSI